LARFGYGLRRFRRRSEDLCRGHGLAPLQYQATLQIAGHAGHTGRRSASSPHGCRRTGTASSRW
jgi:hypothetical protein